MTDTNLHVSNEILGAVITNNLEASEIKSFIDNPQDAIYSAFDVDVSNIDFKVIENSDKEVNLSLPYYSQLDDIQAKALQDSTMQNISGGEIFVTIGILSATGIAVGIAAAVGVKMTLGIGLVAGTIGAVAGGAVVAAGTVAGAVEGTKAQKRK